jgi:hypothetical protein
VLKHPDRNRYTEIILGEGKTEDEKRDNVFQNVPILPFFSLMETGSQSLGKPTGGNAESI